MSVFDPELRKKGLELRNKLFGGLRGEQMNDAFREISPALEALAIELAIGGIMTRPGIDLAKRELVVIAYTVAADMPDGIKAHVQAALRIGVTQEEIFETIFQGIFYTGMGPVIRALKAFKEVLAEG